MFQSMFNLTVWLHVEILYELWSSGVMGSHDSLKLGDRNHVVKWCHVKWGCVWVVRVMWYHGVMWE